MSAEHGTNARYVGGCRCVPCTGAHAEYCRLRAWERREMTDRNGGIAPIPTHGTFSTYSNWGCTCVPCTEANRRNSQKNRARARQRSEEAVG